MAPKKASPPLTTPAIESAEIRLAQRAARSLTSLALSAITELYPGLRDDRAVERYIRFCLAATTIGMSGFAAIADDRPAAERLVSDLLSRAAGEHAARIGETAVHYRFAVANDAEDEAPPADATDEQLRAINASAAIVSAEILGLLKTVPGVVGRRHAVVITGTVMASVLERVIQAIGAPPDAAAGIGEQLLFSFGELESWAEFEAEHRREQFVVHDGGKDGIGDAAAGDDLAGGGSAAADGQDPGRGDPGL